MGEGSITTKARTIVSQPYEVQVRFYMPPAELRRYFTTFYFAEWTIPDGQQLTDYLLPEWANLRLYSGSCPDAQTPKGGHLRDAPFTVNGPNSQAIRFSFSSARMWGIGLLPLGWAKFVGTSAADVADTVFDGMAHPAFARFAELGRSVFTETPDEAAELARITRYFLQRIDEPVADEARIIAIHSALIDPDTSSVSDLVVRSGVSQRTVERICRRHFGFTPKLLLRRQRFMRSLAHFMLDPSLNWIGAMDSHYHDQAQFVRDFRQFMGMSPRQYAALDKPLIGAVMRERARVFGSPVQTMDSPGGPTALA